MNSRQLQYVILLSEIRNFSQVAEKLNITQPALSKQILNLEHELGVKLFDRNTSPLRLTPAGEYFVREAQVLLYKEDQLIRSMDRYKSGEVGRLVIGISPFRSLYLVNDVIKKLRIRYPGLQIFLQEKGSDNLRHDVAEGKYDFAIINLPVDESILEVTPIEPDTLVLAVPNELLHLVPAAISNDIPAIDIKDCKDLPFIVVGQNQEMRRLFDKLCATAALTPNVVMEVVGVTTAWAMANSGIGATLLPLQFVRNEAFDKNVTVFKLKNDDYLRQPAIVMRRGQYVSEFAEYAIELMTSKKEST